jgi:SIR2-like domain
MQVNAAAGIRGGQDGTLERLADMLIARHVRVAIPASSMRDVLAEELSSVVSRWELVERDMHCVAIVGAGASHPIVDRANELATKLEKRFGRDEAELMRLKMVYQLNDELFETRLIALSKNPNVEREVRKAISEEYKVKHPTLLTYELLAHLLKHRFIDAIISCNFDELLDRSLDDELDRSEYISIVSERDCEEMQSDPSATDYIPLYVKLHGTASEPDSLRFTLDSYYSIPERISSVVRELLHAEHCVVLNVGSGLATFDLQQLLDVPRVLDLFNLSYDCIEDHVRNKINEVRTGTVEGRADDDWLHERGAEHHGCGEWLKSLTDALTAKTKQTHPGSETSSGIVQFRSVRRHETIAKLLGPDTVYKKWATTPGWSQRALVEYARRRTILELALAAAKARGLLSLSPLVDDRPARYYDDYRRLAKEDAESWSDLCSAAGLVEGEDNPDALLSREELRGAGAMAMTDLEKSRPDSQVLHSFELEKLAEHVLLRVNSLANGSNSLQDLADTLAELQGGSEVELHMRDDRVCSKAFKRPVTLATATSLEAYTRLILKGVKEGDKVYISSETGDWLLRPHFVQMLQDASAIKLLLAFDTNREQLKKLHGEKRLQPTTIDPWRHNRHMTIVCEGSVPKRAIYFARRLRSPVITAVYLDDMGDVRLLAKLFDQRWKESSKEEKGRRHGQAPNGKTKSRRLTTRPPKLPTTVPAPTR